MTPTYARSAWIFRRLLGLVYVCAFWSLATQVVGLVGAGGILPARDYMDAARGWAASEGIGILRFHLMPTLFWISASDTSLRIVCGLGIASGALLAAGVAPLAATATSWLAYLSLSVVGRDFLAYQWDALLLEAGFLALFVAPARWLDRARDAPEPIRPAVWLLLWLLFRLMAAAGAVKLSSGDPTWRNLTALTYHFETQPLPTPVAWYAHRLPDLFLRGLCAAVIALELVAPLLMLGSRHLRATAFGLLVALQAAIALTGNYAWFNLLTASLCVFLLDDRMLAFSPVRTSHSLTARILVLGAAALTLPASALAFAWSFGVHPRFLNPFVPVAEAVAPLRIANRYGLFAVMTTTRPEIVVEGSDDGVEWRAYEFKYKPGDLQKRPGWVAPHQPRLDWEMWFAALGQYETEPWIRRFFDRLLEASPEVLRLLEHDPFDGQPPRFLRARLIRYRFADRGPGWWTSEPVGDFTPSVLSGPPP